MRSNSIIQQIILGVVLAAVLLPAPAQAQWTVFDPTNFSLQITNQIDSLNRWLETISQYTRMYENAVGQLTNLKGILRTVDDALAHERKMRHFISNWGQAIRMTFRLKNQLVNLVTGAARAVMNIEQRLRNGIFDPGSQQTRLRGILALRHWPQRARHRSQTRTSAKNGQPT